MQNRIDAINWEFAEHNPKNITKTLEENMKKQIENALLSSSVYDSYDKDYDPCSSYIS